MISTFPMWYVMRKGRKASLAKYGLEPSRLYHTLLPSALLSYPPHCRRWITLSNEMKWTWRFYSCVYSQLFSWNLTRCFFYYYYCCLALILFLRDQLDCIIALCFANNQCQYLSLDWDYKNMKYKRKPFHNLWSQIKIWASLYEPCISFHHQLHIVNLNLCLAELSVSRL